MEAKNQEITLGETVCAKLRDIYFKNIPWVNCHNMVGNKFTALKAIARRFYADMDNTDILKQLIKYSDDDIREMFEHEQGTVKTA